MPDNTERTATSGTTGNGWVALDVETTGLSPGRNRILEFAAIRFDETRTIEERAVRLHRSDLAISSNRRARNRLLELLPILRAPATIVAHNAAFDLAFVSEALRGLGVADFSFRACCTLRLARAIFPGLSSYSLPELTDSLSIARGRSHEALSDARAVVALFRLMLDRYATEEELWLTHGPPVRVRYRCSGNRSTR